MTAYLNPYRVWRWHTMVKGVQKPHRLLQTCGLAHECGGKTMPSNAISHLTAHRQLTSKCKPKVVSFTFSHYVNSRNFTESLKLRTRMFPSAIQMSSTLHHTLACHRQLFSLQARNLTSSAALHCSFGVPSEEKKKTVPDLNGLNLLVHAENVYLSWMRNTYLMTIASITIVNFVTSPLPGVLAAISIFLAGMNIVVGSARFIYLLSYLRQYGHMSKRLSWLMQVGCAVHLCLWYIGAILIFPEFDMIEKELDEYEECLSKSEESKQKK